jgi:hypothetical protein
MDAAHFTKKMMKVNALKPIDQSGVKLTPS